jgi:hypothetical protein
LKFGKTPFVNALRLAGLTNPVEVFQDDPLIVRLGVRDDLFADAVIGAREEFNFGGVRRLRGFDGPDLAHYTKVQ